MVARKEESAPTGPTGCSYLIDKALLGICVGKEIIFFFILHDISSEKSTFKK